MNQFEANCEARDIRTEAKKTKWCRALIGAHGLQVMRGMNPNANWEQTKAELHRHFGDEDPVNTAWNNLEHYSPGSKSLGEIAVELATFARRASGDEATQERLATKAFIEAVPRNIRRRLKEKRLPTLKRALEEAKFLLRCSEEDRPINKVEVATENVARDTRAEALEDALEGTGLPREGRTSPLRRWSTRNPTKDFFNQEDILFEEPIYNQVFNQGNNGFKPPVYAQARGPQNPGQSIFNAPQQFGMPPVPQAYGRNQNTFNRGNQRRPRRNATNCFACGRQGHFVKECTLWQEFMDQRNQKAREQQRPNSVQAITYSLN